MLSLTVLVKNVIDVAAMIGSPAVQAIFAAILILAGLYTQYHHTLQPVPIWVYSFQSNHKLHIQLVATTSVLIMFFGSVALIGMLVNGYVHVWLTRPFSMPLIVSLIVMLLIGLTPGVIGAPMLAYLKRFPPDQWMSSRIARLKS